MHIHQAKQKFLSALSEQYDSRELEVMFNYLLEYWGITKLDVYNNIKVDQVLVEQAINNLVEGVPIQHIIGYTFFYDLKIHVNHFTLIPRPETEELVYHLHKDFIKPTHTKIMDMCTGSGCIALSLAHLLPQAQVTAVDWYDETLNVTHHNKKQLGIDIDIIKDNALEPQIVNGKKWDLIVSNPPYIPETEYQTLDPLVLENEPKEALVSPDDNPILFYKKITNLACETLNIGGLLAFEIHENYGVATKNYMEKKGLYCFPIMQDLQGKDRFVIGMKAKDS